MNTSKRRRGMILLLTLGAGLATASCAAPPAASQPSSRPSPTFSESEAISVEADDGRTLSATCSGEGEPVVVYLHGLIQPGDAVSWAHAPELGSRLDTRVRYCEYERANVGRSSDLEGPIALEQTVADLAAVLDEVSADRPVVLVGGSFGGLIAYTFAGMHPERVAGVVMLDPTLPDEPGLERAYLPEDMWLPPDAWDASTEKIDVYAAYATARTALPTTPAVPGTLFATAELWAPDGPNAEPFREGVRGQQADLIGHYTPGDIVTVDAPHAMIEVVPDQTAEAVLAIVDASADAAS